MREATQHVKEVFKVVLRTRNLPYREEKEKIPGVFTNLKDWVDWGAIT
jgi:hypothetical protein